MALATIAALTLLEFWGIKIAKRTSKRTAPPLANMAALTLLHNPRPLPDDVSVDYSPFAEQARLIQSAYRRLLRDRAQSLQRTVCALMRGRPRAEVVARRQIRRRR